MTATALRQLPKLPLQHAQRSPLVEAGLLAGLGAQAGALAEALGPSGIAEAAQRTCVDAGGSLVLGVAAPGPRARHAEARTGGTPGAAYWQGLHAVAGEPASAWRRWRTVTFAGEPAGAWAEVLDWARDAGMADQLRAAHAALGAGAGLFTASVHAAGSPQRRRDELWTGWRLDAAYRPGDALRDVGHAKAWPAALGVLRRLLGDGLGERSHPWAVLLPMHESERVRVATTIWSRVPEDAAKHRRLAEVIDSLGGDGRFAEALYKLLAGAGPEPLRGLGRALLVELEDGEPVGFQALLRAGPPGAGPTRKD